MGLFISVFIVLSLKRVVCCLVVCLLARIANSVGGLPLPCGFVFDCRIVWLGCCNCFGVCVW